MYKIIGADQKEYGPITADQLKQWLAEGRVNARSQVLADSSADWKPLIEMAEFASTFDSALSPPPVAGMVAGAPNTKTNPLAVTGMILGIVSMTVGLCCCYGLPFNLLGIVFSAIGLVQIKNNPESYTGKGMAITGLILSILSIFVAAALLAVGVALNWKDILQQIEKS